MSTKLRQRASGAVPPVSARRQRRRAWVLFAAAAWNAYVWLTRLGIVLDQRRTAGFRITHGVLIAVSLGFAVALAAVGWRMWQEARGGPVAGR